MNSWTRKDSLPLLDPQVTFSVFAWLWVRAFFEPKLVPPFWILLDSKAPSPPCGIYVIYSVFAYVRFSISLPQIPLECFSDQNYFYLFVFSIGLKKLFTPSNRLLTLLFLQKLIAYSSSPVSLLKYYSFLSKFYFFRLSSTLRVPRRPEIYNSFILLLPTCDFASALLKSYWSVFQTRVSFIFLCSLPRKENFCISKSPSPSPLFFSRPIVILLHPLSHSGIIRIWISFNFRQSPRLKRFLTTLKHPCAILFSSFFFSIIAVLILSPRSPHLGLGNGKLVVCYCRHVSK